MALKLKHDLGDDRALGVEAGVKLATAKAGIGSREDDYALNGIYSAEAGDWALDFNLGATWLGAVGPGERRAQLGWAAAAGRPLSEKWGVAFEFSGAARGGTRAATQALFALTYSVTKRTVLDFGVAAGLSRDTPNHTVFAGMTVLF